MLRYVNSTFPTRSRRIIVPEETTNSTILQYLIQMFSEKKFYQIIRILLGFVLGLTIFYLEESYPLLIDLITIR